MSSEPQGTANVRAFKLLDVVKLLPSVGWALMSAVAFPAYAGMGWYTPAILAVVSTLLSAGFAYEILTYHRRFKYVVAGEYLLGWDEQTSDYPKGKMIGVSIVLVIGIAASVVLLHTYYSYVKPCDARYCLPPLGTGTNASCAAEIAASCPANLRPAPCNGACEGCAEDPDCKKWTEHLMAQERMTKICPPPKDEYKGDATFSCAADGWWMVCTNFIATLWLVAVVYTARRVKHERSQSFFDQVNRQL